MDRRPIGVFDSGLGGLTALRQLRKLIPGEDFIYFGDTGRVPYGSRGRDTILRYARQDVRFLRTFDPKAIVVACGTVSANALRELREENDLPIFGVIDPAAQAAVAGTRGGKVGVIATAASVRTEAYEKSIALMDSSIQVFSRACPLFVPLVENGRFRPGDKVVSMVAEEYLAPLKAEGVDTLVLGCTHYPLLADVVKKVMGDKVKLIDTGAACADFVADYLKGGRLFSDKADGSCRYFVSDSIEDFARLAGIFLGGEVDGPVERVDIEKY